MPKYAKWGIITFEVLLIVSLVRGIQMSYRAKTRVKSLETRREKLREKKKELVERLEYVKSREYLDKVAREELNLAQPGETVVIVPEGVVDEGKAPENEKRKEQKNWQKWREVLFGR